MKVLNLAALRGVRVEIILPEKNNLPFVHWASRAMWWQVLERGFLLVSPLSQVVWAEAIDQALEAYGYRFEDEALRLATEVGLGPDDVVIVASVSCIYGIGPLENYQAMTFRLAKGEKVDRSTLLRRFVEQQYKRNDNAFQRGTFRVRGDTIDLFPAHYEDRAWRVNLFGDEVESIHEFDPLTGKKKWEIPLERANSSGMLATGGGIVFTGDVMGKFIALDEETGKTLFRWTLGGGQTINGSLDLLASLVHQGAMHRRHLATERFNLGAGDFACAGGFQSDQRAPVITAEKPIKPRQFPR